jgi:hypothetical protein
MFSRMPAAELRPLSLGEILDVAIKIYWRNAAVLLGLVVLVVAPVQLFVSLIYVSAIPDYDQSLFAEPSPAPADFDTHDLWVAIAAFLIGLVLTFVATTIATAGCFKAVADAYLGERAAWRSSLVFALRRVHSVLWITTLGGILTLIGFVFVIIPGIWLWVSFAVAIPVLLTEGIKGRRALGRSFRLVRHRWWPAFGLLLLGTILASIVSGVVTGLLQTALLTDIADDTITAVGLDAVATTISTTLTTPFTAAFVTVLYFDLRVRREGFDLELLAERLGLPPGDRARTAPLPASPPTPYPQTGVQPPFWPPPPGWQPSDRPTEE